MKNKKGFTLIELIAVLVILAILALIATPLVLNVVKNAKDAANKRSVDAYGKSVELAIASYLLDKGDFPTNINDLTIEYSGSEVVCGVAQLNEDSSVYLSECTVGGKEVKDSSTDDGWYHYGKMNIDVRQAYQIGDEITYNGMNFYVIADSDENSNSVTMLKAEPLTTAEVNTYGGTNVSDQNGYGKIAFGTSADYMTSNIKVVVDAWAKDKIKVNDLTNDSTNYSVRLLNHNDAITNLGYENTTNTVEHSSNGETPSWVYNNKFGYWTMSPSSDDNRYLWSVRYDGALLNMSGCSSNYDLVVRPVITLKKTAI